MTRDLAELYFQYETYLDMVRTSAYTPKVKETVSRALTNRIRLAFLTEGIDFDKWLEKQNVYKN